MTEKALTPKRPQTEFKRRTLSANRGGKAALHRREMMLALLGISSLAFATNAEADDPLVVIVNKGNDDEPSRSDLAAMFSTRKRSWGSGRRVVPFNFPAKHPVRVQFDRTVLRMDPDAVARYWIDRRIRGGNPPPKQVGNARLIVRLIAKLPGGVAYVPRSFVDSSVRVVHEL